MVTRTPPRPPTITVTENLGRGGGGIAGCLDEFYARLGLFTSGVEPEDLAR